VIGCVPSSVSSPRVLQGRVRGQMRGCGGAGIAAARAARKSCQMASLADRDASAVALVVSRSTMGSSDGKVENEKCCERTGENSGNSDRDHKGSRAIVPNAIY